MISNARILVVEDEAIEALDLQHWLEAVGYPMPEIALFGEEALAKAAASPPDVVLMDIMLAGDLDGIVTAERLRASLDVPVIYLTAYADEDTLRRATATEPDGYIVKPFREREMHIAIEMALHRHALKKRAMLRQAWLAAALDRVTEGVVVADAQREVVFMNAAAERMTGRSAAEARNRPLEELVRSGAGDGGAPRLAMRNGLKSSVECSVTTVGEGASEGRVVVLRGARERGGEVRARIEALLAQKIEEMEQLRGMLARETEAHQRLEKAMAEGREEQGASPHA